MKMKKQLVLAVLPVVLLSSLAYADFRLGNYDLNTSVEIGGEASSLNHTSGKFSEYKDIRHTELLSGAKISTEKDDYHLDFRASEIGLNDESFRLNGGVYGKTKYSMYFDSIIHNNTFNAKTFFTGVGTGNLTIPIGQYRAPGDPTAGGVVYDTLISNPALWNLFDYSIKVKNYGVEGSYNTDSPFYVKWGVSQQKTDGVRPIGGADFIKLDTINGASAGTSYTNEMPEPVDFTTNNFTFNTGYKGDGYLVSMDASLSDFNNANPTFTFQVPNVTTQVQTQTFALAPDNQTWKLGLQGTVYHLPMDSTFSARASFSKTSNSVNLLNHDIWSYTPLNTKNPVYLDTLMKPSVAQFNGSNSHGSLNVALASSPAENLETKIYYNFLRNWNDSPRVYYSMTDATAALGTAGTQPVTTNGIVGGRMAYYKHNLGLDAGYKLPLKSKVSVGLDYLALHRTSAAWAYDSTLSVGTFSENYNNEISGNDQTGYLELRNSYFEMVTGKLRFQRMNRKANYDQPYAGYANVTTATQVYNFMHAKDQTSKKEDAAKLNFDIVPMDDLDINLAGEVKKGLYPDNLLGRVSDVNYGTNMGVSYNWPDLFRTSVYVDYEVNNTTDGFTTGTDPVAAPTATLYNWNRNLIDKTFDLGIDFEIPVTEKLDVSLGAQRQVNNGNMTYGSQMPTALPLSNVDHYDNYMRNTLTAKAKYKFTRSLTASVAYMYDKLTYNDFQLDNYNYVQVNSTTTQGASFFTGANTDQNYTAHTVYLAAEYTF